MIAKPRRILVRFPNPLGDAVMATPVLRALRLPHPVHGMILAAARRAERTAGDGSASLVLMAAAAMRSRTKAATARL